NQISARCNELHLGCQTEIEYETALVLWDQGERQASIQMLQNLNTSTAGRNSQGTVSNRPTLLARLVKPTAQADVSSANHVQAVELREARVETPDDISREDLQPAIQALRNQSAGAAAGQVFNQCATF